MLHTYIVMNIYIPRPPKVPLLRAWWPLSDGIWGVLKGCWGVLVHIWEIPTIGGPNMDPKIVGLLL